MPVCRCSAALTSPLPARAPVPSPSRMPRSSSGVLPEPLQHAARWRGLGRDMARRGNGRARRGSSACRTAAAARRDVAVERSPARAACRAARIAPGHGRDLAAAEAAQHFAADRRDAPRMAARSAASTAAALRPRPSSSTPGAAADPVRRRAAVERRVDRRRDGGVADAHLADARAGRRRRRSPPCRRPSSRRRPSRRAPALAVMSPVGMLQRSSNDLEAEIEAAQIWLIAAPPAAKLATICAVTAGREGRDAVRGDAVVAGEDRDQRRARRRRRLALPGGQPFGDLLEPAERARRLGQRRVAPRTASTAASSPSGTTVRVPRCRRTGAGTGAAWQLLRDGATDRASAGRGQTGLALRRCVRPAATGPRTPSP